MLVGVMLVVFTVQMVNDFAVLNSFAIFMPVVYGGGVRVLMVVRLRLLSPMFSGGTRFAGGGACPVKARMSTSHVEATLVTRWCVCAAVYLHFFFKFVSGELVDMQYAFSI
ncbi:hypothetical protein F2Q70_00013089 [Brassica cretica]|uniref:Uncharacterized protein n=1 Tax=Brassica cretica TaxID=69181 RepID=A0A8S9LY08_BRACR|nr:hypothetical protein F2Q70_00013089 [Brassica cretica]